jgi:hypothetical protein
MFNNSCLLHVSNILCSAPGKLYSTHSLIWHVIRAFMQAVCTVIEFNQGTRLATLAVNWIKIIVVLTLKKCVALTHGFYYYDISISNDLYM